MSDLVQKGGAGSDTGKETVDSHVFVRRVVGFVGIRIGKDKGIDTYHMETFNIPFISTVKPEGWARDHHVEDGFAILCYNFH